MRSPPHHIEVLLPVWGERYTRDFLNFSLPSLLAPGNLPALSRLGTCTFVVLTTAKDASLIEASPLWALLQDCCLVRVTLIDDLVSRSSSTVLTLAYALAIRSAGERALNTCFVPLVADYVVSNGSLLSVVEHIFAGASGVLAGNFQVARATALPLLEKSKSRDGTIAISPRSLVDLSFHALHQTTRAEIVNECSGLKPDTNRLFWRVDANCMVGRFFLMHMIAIRPETLDFVITAPSDYSLIPEMCPSGEIVRMTDSDNYFVVECQPESDARQQIAEPIKPRSFAKSLAVWATAMHRRNAEHALIFHRRELPTSLAEMIAVSDRFVADVEANTEAPLPFRHHPMWSRAIDHHVTTAFQVQDLSRLAVITGDTSLAKRQSLTGGVRKIMLGRAPNFRPWHPQWPDVRMLKRNLLDAKGDVALVSDTSAGVRHWLDTIAMERGGRSVVHIQSRDILCISGIAAEPPSARFDRVFLVLEKVPDGLADVLARLVSLMKPGGVLVLCFGQIFSEIEVDSESTFALMPEHAVFRTSGLSLKRVDCVGRGRWRTAVQTAMMRHARHSVRRGNLGAFYGITVAGGLAAISMFLNMISLRSYRSGQSRFSSLVYTLNLTGS